MPAKDHPSGHLTGHLATGRSGEDAALALYLRRGFQLVERNWRCGLGEIDLVFCEVKARRRADLGGPHDAVTWKKQRKLRALAQAFLADGPGSSRSDPFPAELRFDVASVLLGPGGVSVEVFEQAF